MITDHSKVATWHTMLAPQKAMLKSRGLLLAACLCLTLWLFWSHSTADVALPSPGGTRKAVLPPCRHLVDDHETLLVLRTGATEIADRIPTHIGTTLRCYPNHVIFSDYAETLLGERVLDALESVDPVIIANNKDFEVYRRLKEHDRTALAQSELSGNDTWAPGGSGHEEVAGWKLDKWKFLPMVNQTLYEYPNMKWYIFAEGDSFLVWSTLRALLATLDHTQPLYLGSSTNIGNDPAFAHGGSGFIVSQPAMRIIAEHYSFHKAEIEAIVESSWAGDAVLGKVFFNAGIKLTDVWPVLHGESPGQSLFARPWSPGVPKEYEQVWCYPAASLHHTSPSMLDSLWHYEQQWLEKRANVSPLGPESVQLSIG